MVPEVFLPGAEPHVALAARPAAFAGAVGEQAERVDVAQVGRPDRRVPRVGAAGGAGPPEEPGAEAALVGDQRMADVVAERQEGVRGLDPRVGGDVAVPDGGVGQVGGVDRRRVDRAVVRRQGALRARSALTSRDRRTPGGGGACFPL